MAVFCPPLDVSSVEWREDSGLVCKLQVGQRHTYVLVQKDRSFDPSARKLLFVSSIRASVQRHLFNVQLRRQHVHASPDASAVVGAVSCAVCAFGLSRPQKSRRVALGGAIRREDIGNPFGPLELTTATGDRQTHCRQRGAADELPH